MRRSLLLAALGAVLLALPVTAQNTDIEALSGLQFNFANPGARSLGMGGAFLGLADDATAVEANPAGLTILRKPEVSLELRNFLTTQSLATSGTFNENLQRTDFTRFSRRVDVSFASFVYPIRNFAIAAYYNEPLNNEAAGAVQAIRNPFTSEIVTDIPNFFFARDAKKAVTQQQCLDIRSKDPNDPFSCVEFLVDPYLTAVQVTQRTWGLSGAWKVKNFSVGASARYQQFHEEAATFRTDPFGIPKALVVQATGFVDSNGALQLKNQNKLTFTAGFKWEATDKFSIGGVYKRGARYVTPTFAETVSNNFNFQKLADTTFHIPDIAGVGVSIRPIPALTFNVDAVHVTYSNLVDNFVSINAGVRGLSHPYAANDVTEIHAGGEYFFSTKIPLAIRAGYWRDPPHATKFVGPQNDPQFIGDAILFPGGKTQNHRSIGAGLAWQRFQIDAAYDTSPNYKVGSISMVTRF
jgi:long-chain fatty acid transport protein